jgi:hypothetical protein
MISTLRVDLTRIAHLAVIGGLALGSLLLPAAASAGERVERSDAGFATCYLFSYFIENGQDGLHLAWSDNGYTWKALKSGQSFLTPMVGEGKLMRDPSLLRGADGTFHMVWTTSWKGRTIGYASSADLTHWSQQRAIEVMANEPDCETCWALELFYEQQQRRFLIVWSSSIRGKFGGGKRSFAVTTADFKEFTSAKLFFDPGYTVIDETIVPFDGKYCLLFKDERTIAEGKTLKFAVGDTLEGPWRAPSKPFTRRMVEGATWLKIGKQYIVYFDCFRDRHFGAMTTTDFEHWQDATSQIVMPAGARHGTALEVPRQVIVELQKQGIKADGSQ